MTSSYFKRIFVLTLMGTLFAGYLSATKLFTGSCAFNESCPYFLGYPACWYGFFMFASMFALSTWAMYSRNASERLAAKIILGISFAGILFAGSFVAVDAVRYLRGIEVPSRLGIPTCAYGLVFYIAIFTISVVKLRKRDIL